VRPAKLRDALLLFTSAQQPFSEPLVAIGRGTICKGAHHARSICLRIITGNRERVFFGGSMGFTKLDEGIIYSSIMGENDSVFRIWIILLATCKSTGISPLSPVFIKNLTGKSLEEVNKCLEILMAPDSSSRSKNDEGRRIRSVDGGYQVINYLKYRDFTYSDNPEAIKKRRQRKGDISGHVPDISGHSASASVSASLKEEEYEKGKKYYYLSELLIVKLKSINHEIKIVSKRDIPAWATQFRLMVEQDKRTEKEIEAKIEEIFADNFWSGVILSAKTLREKWNQGKLNRLKDSQNAQEGQEGGKPLTGWQQLCRDHGDAGNAVFDKFCKIWDSIEPGAWEHYPHFPKRTAVLEIMKPIYEIMVANNGDPRKIVELGKACFEKQKTEALERQKNAKNTSAI